MVGKARSVESFVIKLADQLLGRVYCLDGRVLALLYHRARYGVDD